ncbi:olfactory receptor 4P4-like [Heterocephalus glaber]|uniref:Olfactory receptor n=1 Tax=Heterocephalus glaber TaxID=10181 RepID=A0AAX6QI71_HETGA|nr:olfactory receptor 4P4-like [Heterocephalus glaber]
MENTNNITEIILLGLSQNKKVKNLCFLLFLFCYIPIWMGDVLIITSITCSQLIDQPMYFLLNSLALSDLYYSSTVTPKLVTNLLKERNTIYYTSCMAQLFAMHFFGGIEVFILTVMAYDRYVAICRYLHCGVVMSRPRCNAEVTACCSGGFLHSFIHCLLITTLSFCGPSEMDHYFYDVFPLLELACTATHRARILVVANSGMMGPVVFVVVMLSYLLIVYTIRAYPTESHRKALSTCSSHVTVVVLFFVPVLFVYIRPAATFPEDKVFALFYTIIAPMFNPLIYTLRNMEMKDAMRKICCQKSFFIGRQLI